MVNNKNVSGQRGEKIVRSIFDKFNIPFERRKINRSDGSRGTTDGFARNSAGKEYCFEVITLGGAHDGKIPCICGVNYQLDINH
jgi:hypothetical protein